MRWGGEVCLWDGMAGVGSRAGIVMGGPARLPSTGLPAAEHVRLRGFTCSLAQEMRLFSCHIPFFFLSCCTLGYRVPTTEAQGAGRLHFILRQGAYLLLAPEGIQWEAGFDAHIHHMIRSIPTTFPSPGSLSRIN